MVEERWGVRLAHAEREPTLRSALLEPGRGPSDRQAARRDSPQEASPSIAAMASSPRVPDAVGFATGPRRRLSGLVSLARRVPKGGPGLSAGVPKGEGGSVMVRHAQATLPHPDARSSRHGRAAAQVAGRVVALPPGAGRPGVCCAGYDKITGLPGRLHRNACHSIAQCAAAPTSASQSRCANHQYSYLSMLPVSRR